MELFRDFWWLMFPLFGMFMSAWGMARESSRRDAILRDAHQQLERGQ
ncbi:hypothetical protein [Terricaulis sp.]